MSDNLELETQDLRGFWQTFKANEGFDPEFFLQLVEDTGEDTTLKIIARFTETLKEAEEHVRRGLEEEDSELIWRACHKVAGSANLIGFTQYGIFSRELSHQIRANPDLTNYTTEVASFIAQSQALISEINATVADLKAHL